MRTNIMQRVSSNLIGAALAVVASAGVAVASEAPAVDLHADIDLKDTASLQRGAKYFANYCLGCHSLEYARYQTIADDLKMSEGQLADIMYTSDKPYDEIKVSMPADEAASWFGATPPNLTLYARSKGSDYIYAYLMSYYVDPERKWGVNNLMLPGSSMPHVLWPLQGFQIAHFEETVDANGNAREEFDHFEQVTEGSMSPQEFSQAVNDITNFLTYVAEPARLKRGGIGVGVLAFLAMFFGLTLALKKEYWKDIK
ncbi:MAG: cytochrome c1 [Pseudomonadota bacterium]